MSDKVEVKQEQEQEQVICSECGAIVEDGLVCQECGTYTRFFDADWISWRWEQ